MKLSACRLVSTANCSRTSSGQAAMLNSRPLSGCPNLHTLRLPQAFLPPHSPPLAGSSHLVKASFGSAAALQSEDLPSVCVCARVSVCVSLRVCVSVIPSFPWTFCHASAADTPEFGEIISRVHEIQDIRKWTSKEYHCAMPRRLTSVPVRCLQLLVPTSCCYKSTVCEWQ